MQESTKGSTLFHDVPGRRQIAEVVGSLPSEWPEDLRPAIASSVATRQAKIVVLDDDPTGTQTVHGVPVLAEWSVEALRAEFQNDLSAFYVLTNSRSLPLPEARALNLEIGRQLVTAAREAGRDFVVVSRSDSTLRGYFPEECDALVEGLGSPPDVLLLIPFFLEGGRYTIDDIHYVADGEWLVPAGETEYARDPAFGYRASNLRQWVEEKTAGRISADAVASLSIEDIRAGGPTRVQQRLESLPAGSVCVVNAASMRDLEVVTLGVLQAEAHGRRFLYRTAASFVTVRAGLSRRPLLDRADFGTTPATGGLMVAGSFVPRTTLQIKALLERTPIVGLEVRVDRVLDGHRREEIKRVAGEAEQLLARGEDVLIYTTRDLAQSSSRDDSLSNGRQISSSLVEIVRSISTVPRYLVAKGGITSSDIATHALGVRRAMVKGQILPGVPVWELGPESRYPGLNYIVFPGNVGGVGALAEVAELFTPSAA